MIPWCSVGGLVFSSSNFSYAKFCPSLPLVLSVVTSPFVPSGNTSLCQITRGHFSYSQTITSAPLFLVPVHSSKITCFCSLLSPWNAFSQVFVLCHPACLTWGHAICLHRANNLSLFLPLQFPFPKSVLTVSFLRCACRFHAHMVSLLPFTVAIVYLIFSPLSFSARYVIPCCHKLRDLLGPKRLSFSLLVHSSCLVFSFSWLSFLLFLFLSLILVNIAILYFPSLQPCSSFQ